MLHGWNCKVKLGSTPTQRKTKKPKKVRERLVLWSDQDIMRLERMLTSNVDTSVPPPPPVAGKVWVMVDSGSEPNVCDGPLVFPKHPIRESAGQRSGLQYKGANGALIPNEGELDITHRESDGSRFRSAFQNAKVHCAILNVT